MAMGQFWLPMKKLNILTSNLSEIRFTAIGGRIAYTAVRHVEEMKAVYSRFVGHVWYMGFKAPSWQTVNCSVLALKGSPWSCLSLTCLRKPE